MEPQEPETKVNFTLVMDRFGYPVAIQNSETNETVPFSIIQEHDDMTVERFGIGDCCDSCMTEMKDPSKSIWCGDCEGASYCSEKCQQEDWQHHSTMCKHDPEVMSSISNQLTDMFIGPRMGGGGGGFMHGGGGARMGGGGGAGGRLFGRMSRPTMAGVRPAPTGMASARPAVRPARLPFPRGGRRILPGRPGFRPGARMGYRAGSRGGVLGLLPWSLSILYSPFLPLWYPLNAWWWIDPIYLPTLSLPSLFAWRFPPNADPSLISSMLDEVRAVPENALIIANGAFQIVPNLVNRTFQWVSTSPQ